MISRELAEKLKGAGLIKPLENGDCISMLINPGLRTEHYKECYLSNLDIEDYEEGYDDVWLPSLSHLLDEIEKRGFGWEAGKNDVFNCDTMKIEEQIYRVAVQSVTLRENGCIVYNEMLSYNSFYHNIFLEEAAGQALLWILVREAGA